VNHRAVFLACAAAAALSIPALQAARGPGARGWALARPAWEELDTLPTGLVRRDTTPPARPVRGDSARRDTARRDTSARSLPADTLVDRLLKLSGYVPVEYAGDSAQFDGTERILRLRGDPQVTREGTTLVARDSLVYQERTDFVAAYGTPRVSGEGEPISGETMYYDLANKRSSVRGAQTKITDNATWLVRGDVTAEDQGRRIYARGSEFTSDDRPEPAYHFKADRIMVIRNRILVGRPAYLYFRNVPVMALPFIVQDLEKGRRSGFLVPQFELNDIFRTHSPGRNDRGTGREISNVGYYWAINPYMGASLATGWRSGTYTQLAANLDYRVRRRFLDGRVGLTRYALNEGSATYTLNGSTSWRPNERTSLSASLDYAQSSSFERNRTVDPLRQTQDLNSSLAVTRELDWGNFNMTVGRRQSLANDDKTLTPSLGLTIEPFTFFPAASADQRRWYNDATLTLGVSAQGSSFDPGDPLQRRPKSDQYNISSSPNLQFGDLAISTAVQYQFDRLDQQGALDTVGLGLGNRPISGGLAPLGGRTRETMAISASTGYQISLIGSTRLTPTISLQRNYIRADTILAPGDTIGGAELADSLREVYGTLVPGPARLNFGAGLSTDLYGFFPGVAGYSAFRHHLTPTVSYTYSPAASGAQSDVQRALFGRQVGQTVNQITIGLNQTFEGKVRQPRPVRGDSMADSARSRGNAATPGDAQKVTLLSINTSAIGYSFVQRDSLIPRFETDAITNSVRSDLLGGLTFTTSHDLFADQQKGNRLARGAFSPYLTSLNTSFSLGANSALFRRLGFGGRPEQERGPAEQRGRTADTAGAQPARPPGGATFTGNNQQAGRGPWNLNLTYSLARTRRPTGDVQPGRFERGDQTVRGDLTFFPTRNWAVSWGTQYSLTSGEFDAHSLHFKRDLYRWEANFDFFRAPNGNTSFAMRVHLIDLPDLKADYNERNLGIDRPEESRTNPRANLNRASP
jgi:hypothetical protein